MFHVSKYYSAKLANIINSPKKTIPFTKFFT